MTTDNLQVDSKHNRLILASSKVRTLVLVAGTIHILRNVRDPMNRILRVDNSFANLEELGDLHV
jgi:hypothetical protein